LNQAKELNKPLLIDFSAAPDWGACARLEAESYGDVGLASFIHENFVPLGVHIKENPRNFRRFDVFWTPTVLVADHDGKERWRLEGYLTKDEFRAHLEMGLARIALFSKKWPDAERRYNEIIERHPHSVYAPQAVYYKGISRYSISHQSAELADTAKALAEQFPNSEWRLRSLPWSHESVWHYAAYRKVEMSIALKASILVLLISPFGLAQDDPLPVLSSSWQRTRRPGSTPENTPNAPARAVIAENKNFQRKARENLPPGALDPNDMTIDGRSAALERVVQESRTPKADDVVGYTYTANVRNASGKTIEVVFWEYRFTEPPRPANVVRRQFLCAMKLKKGDIKELSAFSQSGPSDVIDASSLAEPAGKRFNEEVIVNRIEFSDGSILQRGNWKFDEVKKDIERATSTPWGSEVCRKL
jgi:hypothetical protein